MITEDAIKRDFPSLTGRTYLNTAAESIPPASVGDALQQYLRDKTFGMDGREMHFAREREAKEAVSQLLGMRSAEIGLCSCSSEAYNLLASALALEEEDEVIVNDLDFPAGITPWLAARVKPRMRLWKSREGTLDLEDLAALFTSRTRLVQVSLVSFYNGLLLPWSAFVSMIRQSAAEKAVVSVDVTQALGRCVFTLDGADIIISSTHKWLLGIHGGCVVGVPEYSAARLTTAAGGWYHLRNAFDADRFERVGIKAGAPGFSVGMPSFAPIYALHASVNYLLSVGVENIARHADSLVRLAHEGLVERGIFPLAPISGSGIVAFRHEQSERMHSALRRENIHIMHHAGRSRLSFHGYNTIEDIRHFFSVIDTIL